MRTMEGMFCCATNRDPKAGMTSFERERVPSALVEFLKARESGSAESAAAFCTDNVEMKGPKGSFAGLEEVKAKAFSLKSQAPTSYRMLLQYVPEGSTPVDALYAREFDLAIGSSVVPVRQNFILTDLHKTPKIKFIEFLRLPS